MHEKEAHSLLAVVLYACLTGRYADAAKQQMIICHIKPGVEKF